MNTPAVTLGYVILTVKDVAASLSFYEKAFGLTRRFLHDDNGKAYGELDTGTTKLSFVSLSLAEASYGSKPLMSTPESAPLGAEIAFVTQEVSKVYAHALKAGARPQSEPATKPWGQTVSYVRDPDGHLIEICSPL